MTDLSPTLLFANLPNPIEAIVAIDEDNGYSKEGMIPWHIPEDFKWFRACTRDCLGLMGRGTYEDITRRLGDRAAQSILPGRQIYVLSSSMEPVSNATVVRTFDDFCLQVVAEAHKDQFRKIMLFGGTEVYDWGVGMCDRVHVTKVHQKFGCDRFFPYDFVKANMKLTYCHQLDKCTMETWSAS